MTELEHKRKLRRKHTGEDMTPMSLVGEMLDKLPKEVWEDPTKSALDPAAGDGNFLVAILQRKLNAGHDPLTALSTVFGVELMDDNVEEMKSRLLTTLLQHERSAHLTDADIVKAKEIINYNIVCADALHFDFDNWCSRDKHAKELF